MKPIKSFDYEYLCLLKRGDEKALTYFYNKYAKKVYAMAYYILKEQFAAEDVLQDVFINFWHSHQTIEEDNDIWLILYVTCKQKSLNKLRSILRYEKHKSSHYIQLEKNYNEDFLGVADIRDLVNQAMSKMTPTQKKVFQLSRDEGLSHGEIAQLLSVSPNTVKNHMVAALSILKRYFKAAELITLTFFFFII